MKIDTEPFPSIDVVSASLRRKAEGYLIERGVSQSFVSRISSAIWDEVLHAVVCDDRTPDIAVLRLTDGGSWSPRAQAFILFHAAKRIANAVVGGAGKKCSPCEAAVLA